MAILNEALIEQYRILHQSSEYGTSGARWATEIGEVIDLLHPETVLDYGCGRMELGWDRYDPAVPGFEEVPRASYDLVLCTDVMEHIPEGDVLDVLWHIRGLSRRAYFNISTRPSTILLPNGDNAHATVQAPELWRRVLAITWGIPPRIVSMNEDRVSFVTWDMDRGRAELDEYPG